MSLDLYLKCTHPVKHRSTGLFARRNGEMRELETIEEVKEHFPYADVSDIRVYEYEDNTVLRINLTHNLIDMAKQVPIAGRGGEETTLTAYNLLWHPETNPLLANETMHTVDEDGMEWDVGITRLSPEFFRQLVVAYQYMETHPDELSIYNPSNGWGSYQLLLNATHKLFKAVLDISLEHASPQYYIECDR